MIRTLIRPRRQTDVNVDSQPAAAGESSCIGHSVSRTKDGLILASPRERPAQSHGGSKVVPVVPVEFLVRLRRVLADKLHRCQRTPDSGLVSVGEARSREPEQAVASSDRRGHHSVTFIRHAIPLPSRAEVEREVRTNLPIVFEEPAQLVLVEIPILLVILAVIQPLNILRIGPQAEGLADIGDRAREISQQIFRTLHIRGVDTREIRGLDILDRYSTSETVVFPLDHIGGPKRSRTQGTRVRAWAEMDRWDNFVGVPGIAGLAPEVRATFERVFASGPTDVVSVIPQGRAIANAAVVCIDHAALAKQRPFNRPRDRAALSHELQGFLSCFSVVIGLTRGQLPPPQSE